MNMLGWLRGDAHWRDEDISAYLDGELAASAAARLESHLTGCERCREARDGFIEVKAAVHALPVVAAPRSFALGPEMARDESRATPSRPPGRLVWAPAV